MTGRNDGFTLVELLVSAVVVMAVMAGALAAAAQARDVLDRDTAGLDAAQRLRAGLEVLTRDVRGAGAGPEHDVDLALAHAIQVIAVAGTPDTRGGFPQIQVTRAPSGGAHGRLAVSAGAGGVLRLADPPACPALPACGFTAGMTVAVYDGSGAFDMAAVSGVDEASRLLILDPPTSRAYEAGTRVSEVDVSTFALAPGDDGGTRLIRRTAAGAVQPVLDGVVAFGVSLLAAGDPPVPGFGPLSPPSYGPSQPLPGVDDERDTWPAGENCTMARGAGGAAVSRLAPWGGPGSVAPLTASRLADGPWCPGPAGGSYDADLFRVRRADIRLRVEAASARLRGPAGALFMRAGYGRPATWVPDVELQVAVALPNMVPR